ncbi:ATP-binding protein [Thermodesulfobacteriota bacterium]
MPSLRDDFVRFIDYIKKSGLPENVSIEFMRRVWLMKILSIIGIVNLVPLGIISHMEGNITLGNTDLFMAIVLAGNYGLAVKTRNYTRAIFIGVSFIVVFYLFLLFSGGIEKTGHLWFYTFPLISTFLLGSRSGMYANLMIIGLAMLYFIFDNQVPFWIDYSINFKMRFVPSFLVVALFSYFFEKTRETASAELHQKHEELEKTITDLQDREDELRNIHVELEKLVAERTEQLTIANSWLKIEIEERKRMGEVLEESLRSTETEKAKTEAIIAALGNGISIQDRDFKIVFQNQIQIDMLGDHRNEFCYEAYEGNKRVCEGCPVKKSFQDGEIHSSERYVSSPSGGRYFEITASPLRDSNGEITAGIELVRDITERKQMEQDLLKGRNLESIGILAGGIAHDFNNIMTSIFGNIELALMGLQQEQGPRELLKDALAASGQAVQLTTQLLTFAKGGQPLRQVSPVADLILDASSLVLSGSRIKCSVEIPDDLGLVTVDRGQLSQVFYNLLINAKEAISGEGIITVAAENKNLEGAYNHSLPPGKYIQITIADTGGGIDADVMPRIFDPYFSTKEKGTQRGTGLGLSICHSIIARHHGTIGASSTDSGVTFRVLLPAAEGELENGISTDVVAKSGEMKQKGRILVMDDEEMVRKTSGMMLDSLGFQVDFAVNGQEALSSYRQALASDIPFDAVILDLTIRGGMGGEEAMAGLLEIDPSVKAIVASGYADDPVMSDFTRYGFAASLTKPFDLSKIGMAVRQVLQE